MKKSMFTRSCAAVFAFCAFQTFALNFETATGADIVKENALKESGYTEAQLQNICKQLKGRELTFEDGVVEDVSKDEDTGKVSMTVHFSAKGSGLFAIPLTIEAHVSGAMSKAAESLDAEAKIKQLKGRVSYDPDLFTGMELQEATFVSAGPISAKPSFDPRTVTGADLVKGNAAKESGYSEAQLQNICKQLKGRELTFEDGVVEDVSKDEDTGKVSMTVHFSAKGSGLFAIPLTIEAHVSGTMSKAAESLDAEAKIKQLKGRVSYDPDLFTGMELQEATFSK